MNQHGDISAGDVGRAASVHRSVSQMSRPQSQAYSHQNQPQTQLSEKGSRAHLSDTQSQTHHLDTQDQPQLLETQAQVMSPEDQSHGILPDDQAQLAETQSQIKAPSRASTLKKKPSLKKSTGSLKRSASKRSSHAGSVRSLALEDGEKEKQKQKQKPGPDISPEKLNSAFWTPVPTSGHPTEVLATRFQAWRKVLKDLIAYFREIQKSYDARARNLAISTQVINNTTVPPNFISNGGICEATQIFKDLHRQALTEANKARDMENEVVLQLTGLRSDLGQKIKEIKSLSGDFKNSVEKEMDGTKKYALQYQEALGHIDTESGSAPSKGDPFVIKMALDRQLEKQIEEETYLHRAYLNLESSGRELESIVVGEIQKAYNAYAGILKREADEAFEAVERLREGPLALAKDHEWDVFVTHNDSIVDPRLPVRSLKNITYPGHDHPAATEIRSGMLERKSKYLKNYTPGWYVLSPTHLHEFRSADRINIQAPIMSLYLPEQKLGSHSELGSTSHKFMLKGRQTGAMHRGHSWVFRAESHETMMAWFADVKELTEKRGEDRNAFVRRTHSRTVSGNSHKAPSIAGSSDGGMEEDEADAMPYSSEQSVRGSNAGLGGAAVGGLAAGEALDHDGEDADRLGGSEWRSPSQRPQPGGRFPSDVNVARGLQAPLSPSSEESSHGDRDVFAAAGSLPGSGVPFTNHDDSMSMPAGTDEGQPLANHTGPGNYIPQDGYGEPQPAETRKTPVNYMEDTYNQPQPLPSNSYETPVNSYVPPVNNYAPPVNNYAPPVNNYAPPVNNYAPPHNNYMPPGAYSGYDTDGASQYGEWMAPVVAGVGGAAVGAGVTNHYNDQQNHDPQETSRAMPEPTAIPEPGASSAPMPVVAVTPMPPATSSSQADTGSLSTVPTSIDSQPQHVVNSHYFDKNGMVAVPHTIVTKVYVDPSGMGLPVQIVPVQNFPVQSPPVQQQPTVQTSFDSSTGLKPRPHIPTSKSVTTISDLHVPGEFPKPPLSVRDDDELVMA